MLAAIPHAARHATTARVRLDRCIRHPLESAMPLMPPQGFATPPCCFHDTAHTSGDGAAADAWGWVVTVVGTLGL